MPFIRLRWFLEHFHYYCDVVGFAMCGHSFTPAREDRAPGTPIFTPARKDRAPGTPIFTPARKDRAPGTPIRWNGRARLSFSAGS